VEPSEEHAIGTEVQRLTPPGRYAHDTPSAQRYTARIHRH
jgi:hypothetical protein